MPHVGPVGKTKVVTTSPCATESTGVLALADYIKQQENALLQLQQQKVTLFDIQANATKRSWLEFYLALSVIALIFITIIIWLIIKKKK